MKGGTALNLFFQDMPRLSVDIDVVYTDHKAPRAEALASISGALETACHRLAQAGLEAEIASTKEGDEIKRFVRRGRHQVKIEVNHVFRGTRLFRLYSSLRFPPRHLGVGGGGQRRHPASFFLHPFHL
jgi:hypothetical protein